MEHSSLSLEGYLSSLNVPRETYLKLLEYDSLLSQWQKKINLVGPSTIGDALQRHFLDSAQLFPLITSNHKYIFDLGSGAGFPGLVLSILGVNNISLLESDQRKCIFLSEVIRRVGATAKAINARIEAQQAKAQLITARACASLEKLLAYAYPLLEEGGECLFLKGVNSQAEIKDAHTNWLFHVEQIASIADKDGCILHLSNIRPK